MISASPKRNCSAFESIGRRSSTDAAFHDFLLWQLRFLGLFRLLYGALVKGDIVLADRYHCGYFTVAVLYLMGVDVLRRQHARPVQAGQRPDLDHR